MRRRTLPFAALLTVLAGATPAVAQTWAVEDPVLRQIWDVGMNQSQVMRIAQTLMDSIGPRLTGTPGYDRGADWAVRTLNGWGVEARKEQYGTWNGWRRGTSHIDLIRPRVRTLEGTLLAWSPGTRGRPVEAAVVAIPEFESEAAFDAWVPSVRGRIVATSFPQPTCRPLRHYEQYGATYTTAAASAASAADSSHRVSPRVRATRRRSCSRSGARRSSASMRTSPMPRPDAHGSPAGRSARHHRVELVQ
jgi:carboxypeptidase Q